LLQPAVLPRGGLRGRPAPRGDLGRAARRGRADRRRDPAQPPAPPADPAAGRMSLRERLSQKPPGYAFTIRRSLAIYAGLMVTLLLAALDQTIIATALPKVVSDLGGLTQYSWVFTAYMLTSTVSVPVYGRLGDVHGRRPLMLIAILRLLAGSAPRGLAQALT